MKSFKPIISTLNERAKSDEMFSPFFSTTKIVRFGIPEIDTRIFPGGIPKPCLITILGKHEYLEPSTTWQPLCYSFAIEGCRSENFDKDKSFDQNVLYLSLNQQDDFHGIIQKRESKHSKNEIEHKDSQLKIAWRYKTQNTESIAESQSMENTKHLISRIKWVDLGQYSEQFSLEYIFDMIEQFISSRKELHTRIVLENMLLPIFCGNIPIFISRLKQLVASNSKTTLLMFNSSSFLSSIEQAVLLHQSDVHFSIRQGSILQLSKPMLIPTSMSIWLPVTSHVQWKLGIDRNRQPTIEPFTLSTIDSNDLDRTETRDKSSCSKISHEF